MELAILGGGRVVLGLSKWKNGDLCAWTRW